MFDFFSSVEKKMRTNAANWLELATKIYHYRRDELKDTERTQLQQRSDALRGMLRDKADASKLKLGIESLEEVLRRTGGSYYPKSTIQEYVEFFLVAAIVVLGIRTYFLQPFKIPTNSMWPSYYGMTPEVYRDPSKAPGPLMQAARFLTLGAAHHTVVAPISGSIAVPAYVDQFGKPHIYAQKAKGKKWLIIPADMREYVFFVDRSEVRFKVPIDFDFDLAFLDAFGLSAEQMSDLIRKSTPVSGDVRWVRMPQAAVAGKPIISFDILTGDQLLVDRFTYHFFPPKVGQGFVFRTAGIEKIGSEQYYIKRLVGLPGDDLEVKSPVLYRNGSPIAGAKAFENNAKQVPPFLGYANLWSLDKGLHITVPADGFFAMGDNSYNSSDSRYWGPVPKQNVVGRPLLIYFPFTKRIGPSH